ncbi:probable E3 ubiquitin-protein ligase MID2 [Haliotis rufescens]|uniref:probable E3 ubiquitin-protein ligase MID2 n=1 Tax=Haliotis rufescens TaxID=6454 RepID=UPI00201F89DB|nr:probable E3 ubiquitin-protein ligase MID2 [Haliotis rufescens]XP_046368877.2 probable E3 ubiquitin-protein ligase MID2 [Haliotis rufescens]XP_046368878.2 probable E3 ubiquitin-protein ligase MID2 [Haliotis rufescens]XP_048257535.1 probable E3 ubiquitin-protein ligase MID2 [Haliotis rufescens]
MDENMRRQLSCSVCLELYTDPVLLPCLHSLCRRCVNCLVVSRITECPECKQAMPPDPSKMRKNFPLSNMVEIYKQSIIPFSRPSNEGALMPLVGSQQKASRQQTTEHTQTSSGQRSSSSFPRSFHRQCSTCDTAKHTASQVVCQTCSIAFCIQCLEAYHPEDSGHAIVYLEEAETTTDCVICNSSAIVQCVECQMSFCQPCLENYHPTTSSAPGHTLRPSNTPTSSPHSGSAFPTGGIVQRQQSQPCPPRAQAHTGLEPSAPQMASQSWETVSSDRNVQAHLIEVMNLKENLLLDLIEELTRRHET